MIIHAEIKQILASDDYEIEIIGNAKAVPDGYESYPVDSDNIKQIYTNKDHTHFFVPIDNFFVEVKYFDKGKEVGKHI